MTLAARLLALPQCIWLHSQATLLPLSASVAAVRGVGTNRKHCLRLAVKIAHAQQVCVKREAAAKQKQSAYEPYHGW